MPYLVMEFVDFDFDIVDTFDEAKELADFYQGRMDEYAKYNGEWPTGSRIIITKLIENWETKEIGDTGYFEMKTEKME